MLYCVKNELYVIHARNTTPDETLGLRRRADYQYMNNYQIVCRGSRGGAPQRSQKGSSIQFICTEVKWPMCPRKPHNWIYHDSYTFARDHALK